MDIQIVDVQYGGDRWLHVHRTLDGVLQINRMPREMLAMRAAEYNLELDDPFALDMMLLENFYPNHDPEASHPLHVSETIEEAVVVMKERIEWVRNEHNAPQGANRMIADAIANSAATQGAVDTQRLLIKHGDKGVIQPVQFFRDKIREEKKRQASRPTIDHATYLNSMMHGMKETSNARPGRRPSDPAPE